MASSGGSGRTRGAHGRDSRSGASSRWQVAREVASSVASAYASYEPTGGERGERGGSAAAGDAPGANPAVKRIAGALRDAVASVDELKRAARLLERVAGAGDGMRSTEMRALFDVASAAVSSAATWAPALLSREDLMHVFGSRRFLVTPETAGDAAARVRKAEAFMKDIVRGIGRDLVAARPGEPLPKRKKSSRARARRASPDRKVSAARARKLDDDVYRTRTRSPDRRRRSPDGRSSRSTARDSPTAF